MTEIQKKLMQLMGEIDDICTREELHYVLTHQTAQYVNENKKFINSAYEFQLLMPLPDIFMLKKAVSIKYGSQRAFESWEDNPSLRQMTFRYVDTGTLLIDDENPEYHAMPGVAVTIYTIKTEKPSRDVAGSERYLQMYNEGRKKSFWISVIAAKIAGKCFGKEWAEEHFHIEDLKTFTENTKGLRRGAMRATRVGMAKLARYVLDNQKDCSSYSEARELWYMRYDGSLVHFPKKYFENTKRIPMEQWEFPLPSDLKGFYNVIYGKGWDSEQDVNEALQYYPISNRVRVISDTKMPYSEYLDFIKDKDISYENNMRYRTEYSFWLNDVHAKIQEESYQMYLKAKSAVARIDIWKRLEPKRQEIRDAYANNNVDQLGVLLKEYMNVTEKYRKKGIGFYIDRELFDCAKLVWNKKKSKGYAEEVYALVPNEYVNESLEEYFSNR